MYGVTYIMFKLDVVDEMKLGRATTWGLAFSNINNTQYSFKV